MEKPREDDKSPRPPAEDKRTVKRRERDRQRRKLRRWDTELKR